MRLRTWLVRRLGGDEIVGDPDAIVEVGLVDLWQSELLRTALSGEGIASQAVHEASAQANPQYLRPMARLLVARRDYRRAFDVVARVQRGDTGVDDVAWPPEHALPWSPPRSDGARP